MGMDTPRWQSHQPVFSVPIITPVDVVRYALDAIPCRPEEAVPNSRLLAITANGATHHERTQSGKAKRKLTSQISATHSGDVNH